MKRLMYSLIPMVLCIQDTLAITIGRGDLYNHGTPDGTILKSTTLGITGILALIQSILLKVVLPIIVVGASIYIAYQLFTADGDETKMKKAWKSVAYSGIALVAIALSYAIVRILSTISL